ncbi:MAG: transcription elongation factor GreA [Lachnospiraceae bacterium]|nr:transcription elongation factor GreA [Lachnospiraceae bacterium]
MEEKKNQVSHDWVVEKEAELDYLKGTRRKEVAEKLKEARGQGDLSENAEYDAAKDEQREVEMKIEELEAILREVEIIDEDDVSTDQVNIGCNVTILDVELNEKETYKIVGSSEANSFEHKLSNESPIGKALLGAKKGQVVEVEAPGGVFKYKVVKIERPKK